MGQNCVYLYSSSMNVVLYLGYLIDQNDNVWGGYLGKGFDLSFEVYGVLWVG